MTPAREPRDDPRTTRLLVVDDAAGTVHTRSIGDLANALAAGDLLVCNDAATLPASLPGHTTHGEPVEVRLAAERDDGAFVAVLFGAGDWRTRTEDRAPPPVLRPGDRLHFAALAADVLEVDGDTPRLVTLRCLATGAALWRALYASGHPVQYAHVARSLALWDVQTAFAGRPWSFEPPSAALPLTWDLIAELRARGVELARITHGAGLSSTGDRALDARLPLPERYDVPAATVATVGRTRARSGRVIALGTSAVRALESAARSGTLQPGAGVTDLRLHAHSTLRVVDAVVTGLHEPGTSHFALLEAFADATLLHRALTRADAAGFVGHEFGDAELVFAAPARRVRVVNGRAIA